MSDSRNENPGDTAAELTTSLAHPAFSDLDRRFAEFITRHSPTSSPAVPLAAAIVSHARGEGHTCMDLRRIAGRSFPPETHFNAPPIPLPEFNPWASELRQSPVVGKPGDFTPLVLDSTGRLYLHRYWHYEDRLARAIRERAGAPVSAKAAAASDVWLEDALRRYFPKVSPREIDWQQFATFTALTRPFCVISGGPGTGKTRTVAIALAMLLELSGERPLRIGLAAPTGKAAARLQESIGATALLLPCSDPVRSAMPREAVTLHRLLGLAPDSSRPKYDPRNPLSVDALVIDESSMVDLALMAKVLDALPAHARLILLGDKDQLASVEAGAVLGDICDPGRLDAYSDETRAHFQRVTGGELPADAAGAATSLGDCVVQLRVNYRFGAGSGVQTFSQAVNEGDIDRSILFLRSPSTDATPDDEGLTVQPLPSAPKLKQSLRDIVLRHFGQVFKADDAHGALQALGRFRILCAVRQGPFGVEQVNQLVEEVLAEEQLISPGQTWYAGRPVLITRNDYNLRLFNGDIGVIRDERVSGARKAFFVDAAGALRGIASVRLPDHETVFAMTVHKSQGSEFEEVLFILPDRDSPILTRELVYTGLTRARRKVELWTNEPILRSAIGRRVERSSGLRDALWHRDSK